MAKTTKSKRNTTEGILYATQRICGRAPPHAVLKALCMSMRRAAIDHLRCNLLNISFQACIWSKANGGRPRLGQSVSAVARPIGPGQLPNIAHRPNRPHRVRAAMP